MPVIPGHARKRVNPESKVLSSRLDSGSGAAHRPGMTERDHFPAAMRSRNSLGDSPVATVKVRVK